MKFCTSITERIKPYKFFLISFHVSLQPHLISIKCCTIRIKICREGFHIVSLKREFEESISSVLSTEDISSLYSKRASCSECFLKCRISNIKPSSCSCCTTCNIESIECSWSTTSEWVDITTILDITFIRPVCIACSSSKVCSSTSNHCCRSCYSWSHSCPCICWNWITIHCYRIVSKKIKEVIIWCNFKYWSCIRSSCPSCYCKSCGGIRCNCTNLSDTKTCCNTNLWISPLIYCPCPSCFTKSSSRKNIRSGYCS